MGKYLRYIGKWLLVLTLVLSALDWTFSLVFEHNSVPRNKMQYACHVANQTYDVVFLGNSRVQNNIDVDYFEELTQTKALNLGLNGTYLLDSFLFLKVLNQRNHIKEVYLQVDYRYNTTGSSSILLADSMPFLRTNETIKDHFAGHLSDYSLLNYVPFYRYLVNAPKIGFREMLLNLRSSKPKQDFSNGYIALDGSYYDDGFELPQHWNTSNADLDEIVRYCQTHDIKLTLFTAPYSPAIPHLSSAKTLEDRLPQLKNYAQIFNDNTYFYNNNHLNREGARQFTKLLSQDWKNSQF